MRLRELDASFLKMLDATSTLFVDTIAEANGIRFLCPLCFQKNGGAGGTHSVTCWFVGVDPLKSPGPGRWTPSGTGLDDLSFVPGPGGTPSVKLLTGCGWHGYIQGGEATIL